MSTRFVYVVESKVRGTSTWEYYETFIHRKSVDKLLMHKASKDCTDLQPTDYRSRKFKPA